MNATAQKDTVLQRIKRDFKTINLGIFFDEATRNFPDKTAIIDLTEAEPCSYTYTQVERKVRRGAQALAAAGLHWGDRCAIALPNGLEFLVAFLGALRL